LYKSQAVIAGFFGRAIGDRGSQLVTCGALLLSAALGILLFRDILATEEARVIPLASCIVAGGVDVVWSLRLDTLSGVMLGVGTVAFDTAGGAAASQALTGTEPQLVLVFCSDTYDLEDLLRGINETTGSVTLVGCSTAGEIATNGLLRNPRRGTQPGKRDEGRQADDAAN